MLCELELIAAHAPLPGTTLPDDAANRLVADMQVMEEPQRRKVFYMTMGVVAVMFVLYLVLKRR